MGENLNFPYWELPKLKLIIWLQILLLTSAKLA